MSEENLRFKISLLKAKAGLKPDVAPRYLTARVVAKPAAGESTEVITAQIAELEKKYAVQRSSAQRKELRRRIGAALKNAKAFEVMKQTRRLRKAREEKNSAQEKMLADEMAIIKSLSIDTLSQIALAKMEGQDVSAKATGVDMMTAQVRGRIIAHPAVRSITNPIVPRAKSTDGTAPIAKQKRSKDESDGKSSSSSDDDSDSTSGSDDAESDDAAANDKQKRRKKQTQKTESSASDDDGPASGSDDGEQPVPFKLSKRKMKFSSDESDSDDDGGELSASSDSDIISDSDSDNGGVSDISDSVEPPAKQAKHKTKARSEKPKNFKPAGSSKSFVGKAHTGKPQPISKEQSGKPKSIFMGSLNSRAPLHASAPRERTERPKYNNTSSATPAAAAPRDFKRRRDEAPAPAQTRDNKRPAPAEKVHPSWAAKQRQHEQAAAINAFKGTKIKFNDDE